jgi:hypothetical protein
MLLLMTIMGLFYPPDSQAEYCHNAKQGVKTTAMINRYLGDLVANSFGYAVLGSVGRADSSKNGQQITAILIGQDASWVDNLKKPTIIITGAIHGNEWATVEVCLGIAEYLLENKDNGEPARDDKGELINLAAMAVNKALPPTINNIKQLLTAVQVVIIPVYNPEGYDYSQTMAGKKSYYGAGWRPNRQNLSKIIPDDLCYDANGEVYKTPPADTERCFLADFDDTASGGELEEEEVVVCESMDRQNIYIFADDLRVASADMYHAIYNSTKPKRMVCATGQRRVWRAQWADLNDNETYPLAKAKEEDYLSEAYGTDMNRNFQYKWEIVKGQEHLFIRTRSPASRMFRGVKMNSEEETSDMKKFISSRNVVALIDYHAGSTQVLYPYAYSTEVHAEKNILVGANGMSDLETFKAVSEQLAKILNRHDRGDESIRDYSAAQNYNGTSVGSGVARDCYYATEGIAAINIEVHDKRYTYDRAEFGKVVPKICQTNVPGAIWFLFWAAGLEQK